jgi:hypothetical protein
MIGTVIKTVVTIVLSFFRRNKKSAEVIKAKENHDFARALKNGDSIEVAQRWKKRKTYS